MLTSSWSGWNSLLMMFPEASAVTGWRIHLRAIADTPAWSALARAMAERRALTAVVAGHAQRGLRVELGGLYALLPRAADRQAGEELQVRVLMMDADEGKIVVTRRLGRTCQLALPH